MDSRTINLDGFAREDPEVGLVALRSPADPRPSLRIEDGRVAEMDGVSRDDFDSIDWFIADFGIDLEAAPEAMAIPSLELARMAVDPSFGRSELLRLTAGITPAKMAEVVADLRPFELQIALAKMRVRRTPSNQAHVTNQLDDPLLLAADAATAVAFGFREIETTVPVLGDAASNAVAILIGSQVGVPGALTQCAVEESVELELAMQGLTMYAETVSIYGTDSVFEDGDDTPWSKTFLAAAYASRGLKMRVTSGAASEVLMGGAGGRSMLYLESRCVSLARAMGVQGVQNGGIDGASVAASVPGGMRELVAENLMVMMRGLESCSGNDTKISESDIRRTAHTMPVFFAGSDFIFSGFGSIPGYDNAFAQSNFNAEDIDDYLVLQRDWGVDGGIRPRTEADLAEIRYRAVAATRAVYSYLGLADYPESRVAEVVSANGSRDLEPVEPLVVLHAAEEIRRRGINSHQIAESLRATGFEDIAENLERTIEACVGGDHLQPAAIFDEDLNVLSGLTDPNDYAGPGTGYYPDAERLAEQGEIRQLARFDGLVRPQPGRELGFELVDVREAEVGEDPREVVIGVSPATGITISRALSGVSVAEVLRQVQAGLEEEGCTSRIVRITDSIDVGKIGLAAARLSGSGIGVGLQAKGTALIHRRDLPPLANLELFAVAPLVTLEMYRRLGSNAGRHAKGSTPSPIAWGGTDEAIAARYHAQVVALVSLEREASREGPPMDLELVRS